MRSESASNSTNVGNYNNPTSRGEIKNLKKGKGEKKFSFPDCGWARRVTSWKLCGGKMNEKEGKKKVGGGGVLALTCSSGAARLFDSGSTGLLLLGVNVCKKRQYNQEQKLNLCKSNCCPSRQRRARPAAAARFICLAAGKLRVGSVNRCHGKNKKNKGKKKLIRTLANRKKQAFTES